MRPIEFRGKRKDTGEWVEGFFVYDRRYEKSYIYHLDRKYPSWICEQMVKEEVIPKTVGQYTGRCDDKQIKIYADDLLRFSQHLGIKCGIVFYNEEMAAFCLNMYNYFNNCIWENELLHNYIASEDDHVIILGNIHNNPELMEKL